jgi:hypothetical protein
MSNPENNDALNESAPVAPEVRNASRRRVLRGAAAATPVVLTLVSRPVLGWQCKNASAAASAGSTLPDVATYCTGRTPEFWSQPQNFVKWPAPYVPGAPAAASAAAVTAAKSTQSTQEATPFHCATTGFNGAQFRGKTMLEVMQTRGIGTNQLEVGAYLGAALLNARLGLTPVLSEFEARRIWNE